MNELLDCKVYQDPGFSRGGFFHVPKKVRSVVVCDTERVFEDGSRIAAQTHIFVTRTGKEFCRMETWTVDGRTFILGSSTTCVPDGL